MENNEFLVYGIYYIEMWRRQWQPTPVLLPGKSHGWRSLVGYSPWGPKSQTQMSDFTFTFHFHALEKEMSNHSIVVAWRIPGTGEPGGLPFLGSHRVGHDWRDLAAAAAVIPTSVWSLKKQESSRKTSTSGLLTMSKPFTVWITTNWKILLETRIPDHLTCLLTNLYAGQEATVRTGHGTTDWF